jgi:putative DNA primase/helicase
MATNENHLTDGEVVPKEFGGSGSNVTQLAPSSRPHAKRARKFRPTSKETLVERAVASYLADIADDPTVTHEEIRDALLQRLNAEFSLENIGRKDSLSPSPPLVKNQSLDEITVASVLLARHRIAKIDLTDGQGDEDMSLLCMYVESGRDVGIYATSENAIKALASDLKPSMTVKALESVYSRLRVHAKSVCRTQDPNLSPVANGVFSHNQQELLPFSPDWVFLSKAAVPYDPDAESPTIETPHGDEWEVEQWMRDLSDDAGVPELLWETISASVRPHVRWNKSVWFMAESGNNGKGTIIELMRNIVGPRAYSSVQLADFGEEFKMEPLTWAMVNLVDENDVGAFGQKLGAWKAAQTGDPFTLNRKYKTPVAVRWSGFEVQCFNTHVPRVKDKSLSFLRRVLMVPFKKSYTGVERKYIKNDFLARPDVLKYVLRRVLEMGHTELSEPQACIEAKNEYMGANNILLSFWDEFERLLVWDLVPFRFLHDLYREWFRQTNPSGQPESQSALVAFLHEHLGGSLQWEHKGSKDVRPASMMSTSEPLIAEYNLTAWMNSSYTGADPLKKSIVSPLKVNYKGLIRRKAVSPARHVQGDHGTD